MSDDDLAAAERSQVASDPPPTLVEWTVRAASLALVVALLAYLAFTGLQPSSPPSFRFEVDEAERRGAAWVVPVVVTNAGDVSVAALEVAIEVIEDGAVVDSESVMIATLGEGGSVDTEFWLGADPAQHEVRIDVGGYEVP